jgi:eukaryotic-like serine/threonine-protein kinase
MIGQEFAGYSITRRLANGGLTNIAVGLDAAQQRVLIRRLRPEFSGDRRMRAIFQHGAEVLAKLRHPNVVRFIKAGAVQDQLYSVVEYVDGMSMRELILQRSQLLKMNPLPMLRQMAAALGYVHLAGFLHLDFKPENIIIRNDGHVVLIDFDLAIERKPKPIRLHPLPGTFAYMPPESITKELVDDQTDIYSLGVTAYEMLTGHKPYEGVTVEDSHRLQLNPNVRPKSLRLHNVNVCPALDRFIFKCLAQQQSDRYPSMSLVQRDLETMV